MGSWVSNTHGHAGFGWFGPQNHHRLIWAGRGLDKIDGIKDSDGHVVDIVRLHRSEASLRSHEDRRMESPMYLSFYAPTGLESVKSFRLKCRGKCRQGHYSMAYISQGGQPLRVTSPTWHVCES